ncbi:MAG: hypothetical protein MAG581_00354 [Deltaproteobacteria bacterium]|nr:hypothetical protein [Deltaproteobacteria bacterium]
MDLGQTLSTGLSVNENNVCVKSKKHIINLHKEVYLIEQIILFIEQIINLTLESRTACTFLLRSVSLQVIIRVK